MKELAITTAIAMALLQSAVPAIVENYCSLFNKINRVVENSCREWTGSDLGLQDLNAEEINAEIQSAIEE